MYFAREVGFNSNPIRLCHTIKTCNEILQNLFFNWLNFLLEQQKKHDYKTFIQFERKTHQLSTSMWNSKQKN